MNSISGATLKRLPLYLSYLRSIPSDAPANISSTAIANVFGLGDVQVRKDLAAVGEGGKPKIGYIVEELIDDIEECLGYRDLSDAVLVGAGNLGKALLCYDGFADRHMSIVLAFDSDESLIGTQVNGKHILSSAKLKELCERMKIKIGIITVPAKEAQKVCNELVSAGVLAIWNFAKIELDVPDDVMVLNENIGSGLVDMLARLAEICR